MNQTLALGPLTFTYGLLLAIAGGLLGSWAGRLAGRADRVDIEPLLFRILLAGLLAARLAFVVQFRDGYLQAPLGILDIRDGGWSPLAGLAVAAAYAIVAAVRRPGWRKPLAAALGTAGMVWLLGALSLSMMSEEGGQLPPLAVQSLEGQTVQLASFQGKPTVVNLWATWCPPCREEMPMLAAAQRRETGVTFLFVNQGESASAIRAYLVDQDLDLSNVLLDAARQLGPLVGSRGLPTTLFYDARGRLVDAHLGVLNAAALESRLRTLRAGAR